MESVKLIKKQILKIKGADPNSFQIVDGGNLLSKDKSDFYFAETPLHVLDLPSFKIINNGWKKDAKAYYTTPNFSKAGRVDCDYLTMKYEDPEQPIRGGQEPGILLSWPYGGSGCQNIPSDGYN